MFNLLSANDLRLLDCMLLSPDGTDVGFFHYETGAEPREVEAFIRKLRHMKCEVEQPRLGVFRLVQSELTVWQEYLEFVLAEAAPPPWKVLVYRRAASTQDVVREQRKPRVVALADEQSAGRGRRGRSWLAPPGSAVLLSLSHPLGAADDKTADRIQCIAAVAVAKVLERLSHQKLIQIKWPNDLIVNGRKLAGILVETFGVKNRRKAVIGIGINVSHTPEQLEHLDADLRQRIISVREIGCPYDRLHIAAEVIIQLDQLLQSPHQSLLLDEWRVRNLMRSQRTTFQSDGQTVVGEVVDLDADAGLIVRTDSGTMVHLHAATTTIVP
jgi:BirA family biotin operon repressor/biotin-[acetyl-CoA-carboxylase] ligase